MHIGADTEARLAHCQRHHDFLEGGIPGAFADPVSCALDLPGPGADGGQGIGHRQAQVVVDRKSTRLNSSHRCISYAVFCLKKKKLPTPRRVTHDTTAVHTAMECHDI